MADAEHERNVPWARTETMADPESGPAPISVAASPDRPGSVLAKRFELRRVLGEGSSGRIYEAFDRDAQKSVAVKVLRRIGPRAIQQMKQEARELASFSHPNLVTAYDLVAHEGDWLFSMEYINGVPFDTAVRDERRARLARLAKLVPQLVAGIRALHARGRVHRDLKPANVLVTPEDRVVIVDFGLVRESFVEDTEHGFAGTPAYAAPEQLLGQAAGPYSDWYAVGVMLYEALTGVLPYRGTVPELAHAKARGVLHGIDDGAAGLAVELAAVCKGLLEPDPGLRLDGEALLAAFSSGLGSHADLRASTEIAEPGPAEILVGRQRELERLQEALAQTSREGRPITVFVHGPSGIGKSFLVRTFAAHVERVGAVTIVARSNPNEQLPFQTLDAVVDALASYLRKLPLATGTGLLNPEVHALAQLFPVLKQLAALSEVPVPARAEQRDEAARRDAAARGLGALLASVSSRAPLVLVFEDLHDSDPDDEALLAATMRHLEGRVLVVATSRNENARAVLGAPSLSLALDALSSDETRQLVTHTLGVQAATSVLDDIVTESGGNPLHAHELAVGFGGAPRPTGASLEQALARRIETLEEAERELLRAAALARTSIDREILLSTVRAAELTHLSHLTRARILRAGKGKGGKVVYETYHQPLAEAVLSGFPSEDRAALHGRLADAYLLRGGPGDIAAAVIHLVRAGRNQEAAEHASSSAQEAVRAFAFHRAADLFSLALSHLGDGPKRRELETNARQVFSAAGRFRDAARSYAQAAVEAEPEQRFDLERQAMENAFFAGDHADGFARLLVLSRSVGLWIPSTRLGLWIAIALRGLRYLVFGLPTLAKHTADGLTRKRAELAWSATAVQNNDMILWGYTTLLAIGEAARAGLHDEHLIVTIAWAAGLRGMRRQARPGDAELIARAEARAAESAYEAWLHVACGIYHYYAGSLGRASDAFERATQARGRVSLAAALRFGRAALLACWYFQGQLSKIRQFGPDWADEALRADDGHLGPRIRLLASMSQLDRGPAKTAEEFALIAATDRTTVPLLSTDHWWRAWVMLYAGQLEDAYQMARRLPFWRPADMPSSHHVLALAARGQVAAVEMARFPRRRRELDRAIRHLKRSSQAWAPAFVELLTATRQASQGQSSAASETLTRAERAFEAIGMRGYLAAARVRRGELLGGERGRQLALEGRSDLRELGFVEVERWLAILAPGFPDPRAWTDGRGQAEC